jgi:hypothetical protein
MTFLIILFNKGWSKLYEGILISDYKRLLFKSWNTIIKKFFIFLFYPIWALQILPPLTEISSSRFVRKGIPKVWFGILAFSWSENEESFLSQILVGD